MSKFNERLCIQFKSKHKLRYYDLLGRRLRISDIHNESKQYIKDCDYIFGLEDDTIFQTNVLTKLLKDYAYYPHAGFIEGVQVARHGIPHVGAWKIDDIYYPTIVESLPPGVGIDEIDSGGFYCYLTKKENYMNHEYKPFGSPMNVLGPDVNYGLELRRLGLLNYIDWEIPTTHKTKNKEITLANSDIRIAVFKKKDLKWSQSNHA